MEQIKEAFSKVKQDIDSLKKEISELNKGLVETREGLIEVCEILKTLSRKVEEDKKERGLEKESEKKNQIKRVPTQPKEITTDRQIIPAHNLPYNPPKAQNYGISTGNGGVPTDRQTDQQTDQHTQESSYNKGNTTQSNSIDNAAQILESLDNLKKEIRLKFKRLTDQEFSVFSTIYQLSEEFGHTDYKNLSEKLNLTESSIRDYVGRLIKKGIPLDKTKLNNKTVYISISPSLKKVASLPTILQLRTI